MFRIADGREHFYQWDVDRQIIVEDSTITEVHFCNRTDDCSLVVEVVDGLANVPNVILQKSFDIRVFGYDGKATRYDETFKVKARTKPTDYVYTEVEIKRYEDLEEHLDERLDDIVKNGIKVDLTDYYTKEETELLVEEAVADIDIPDVDLSNYYTKDETDSKIEEAISNIDIPGGGGGSGEDIDLSNYVTLDSEQEISGDKTFTRPVKVVGNYPENNTCLVNQGLQISSLTNKAFINLRREGNYGVNFYLSGSGYSVDSDDETKHLRLISSERYASLGSKAHPWLRLHVKQLSDGTTTKSVSDLLAAPSIADVNKAIQDALSEIGVAEGGSF